VWGKHESNTALASNLHFTQSSGPEASYMDALSFYLKVV
jgi:hypothetical protein